MQVTITNTAGEALSFTGDTFLELAAVVHEGNKKWWVDPKTGAPIQRNKPEMLMLMVSEIAEAMEGERKDLMDDHLPHRKMAEVEMADFIIRLLDFIGGWGYTVTYGIDYHCPAENRAEQLFWMCKIVGRLGECLDRGDAAGVKTCLGVLISAAEDYCRNCGYDLWGAVAEKHAYNKVRADHKLENRLKEGGKKW